MSKDERNVRLNRHEETSSDDYLRALGAPETPPEHHFWRNVKRVIIGLILLIIVVAIVFGFIAIKSLASISKQPFSLSPLATDGSGRTNVLILGIGDPGHSGAKLSDTNLVVSFDSSSKRVAEISVPRDLRVTVPGYGYNKINTANALGGSDLARTVVSQTLGIPIQYVITSDFTGLSSLVDAVGGIDVDVKDALVDPEYPCPDNQYKACGLNIQPGVQHMNGAIALEYVRCRKGTCGNDFGRAARQQEVINLVRQKATSPAVLLNPVSFNALASAIRNNLVTDLSAVTMAQLVLIWQQQKGEPITLVFSTATGSYLSNAYGSSDLVPRTGTFSQIQSAAQNVFK